MSRRRRGVWPLAVVLLLVAAGCAGVSSEQTSVRGGDRTASDGVRAAGPSASIAGFSDVYSTYSAGCLDLGDADALNAGIADGLGPLFAFDSVHVLELDQGRQLWLVQDAVLDWPEDGPAATIRDGQFANNLAIVFEPDGCGTILVRPQANLFEIGVGEVVPGGFFWPLGLELHGDRIYVFWAQMAQSAIQPNAVEGINRHPTGTYLATYDARTFERLSFEPAPEPGVNPQWGFELVSDDEWSYLYANRNLLNLAMSGGYAGGPHPSIDMFVGRVPLGDYVRSPEVWDGQTWSSDLDSAAVISRRGYFANQMHPRRIDDYYVSVTTLDEFWDDELVVDVALDPRGPWVEADRIDVGWDYVVQTVSYQPALLPVGPDGTLIALVSYNGAIWDQAVLRPEVYRPIAIELDRDLIEAALDTLRPR